MILIVIYGLCALLMIGIGIASWRGEKPAGFYSGVEPPKAEELTDLKAWNRKHGLMWIVYGAVLLLSGIVGSRMAETPFGLIPILGGALLPLPFMVFYHERLSRVYLKKKSGKD